MPRGRTPPCNDGGSQAARGGAGGHRLDGRLQSGTATPQDHQDCQRWQGERPENAQAWAALDDFSRQLKALPSALAHGTLAPAPPWRRTGLKRVLLIGGAGALGLAASAGGGWHALAADHRTGVGERRRMALADGSVLHLNTATAVDVHLGTHERRLSLRSANDVLANTTGVSVDGVETDRSCFNSRGFDISDFQFDGVGMPFTNGDQLGDIDTAPFDRIEVLRGANGLLSSTGNPAATVNYVRKRPTASLQASAGLTLGSWRKRRVDGDVPRTTRSPNAWTPAVAPCAGEASPTRGLTSHPWKTACGISMSGTGWRWESEIGAAQEKILDKTGVGTPALAMLKRGPEAGSGMRGPSKVPQQRKTG